MTENKTALRKKRTVTWIASVGVAAAMLCGCMTGVIVSAGAEEEKYVLENGSVTPLTQTYAAGTEFTLPKNAVIKDGSKQYEASVILRDPDGNGFTAEKVNLTLAGKYSIEYRAQGENGKLLFAQEQFSCLNPLYSVSTPRSSAKYVESKALQNSITGGAGIDMSVAKGDTFYYNQVLDLSNATKDEKLITFYVTPETLFNYDAGQIHFTFTDAFDEDNTLTVTVKRTLLVDDYYMLRYSYITANSAEQKPTGINQPVQSQYPTVTVDGEQYSLHVDNLYGRAIIHSMYGGYQTPNGYLGKTMSLSFDAATKRVYAWAIDAAAPVLVADLDDPAMFDDVWGGFPSGKVKLSISMSSYLSLTSNVVITQIAGDDLSQEFANDNNKPTVSVDLQGYSADELPKARLNTPYPLFAATAADETDGDVNCDVSVWYNYTSQDSRIRVSTDGKTFTPTLAGTYTVVYSAKDRFGNVENKAFNVEAENLAPLTVNYTAPESGAAAGKTVTFSNVSIAGGSGNQSLKLAATLQSDPSVSYTLTGDGKGNHSFVPLYAGKYNISLIATDWLEEKEQTFELTVAQATGAYIAEEASVPRYAITGATYPLPELYGYDLSGSPKKVACTATMEGGTVSGNTFLVTANEGNVKLTYTIAMDGGEPATKEYFIPVVAGTGVDGEAGALDISKLFVNSNFAAAPAYPQKEVTFAFTDEEDSFDRRLQATVVNDSADAMAYGAFDFVNKVLASSLKTRFTLKNTEFGNVSILITDSLNPNQKVKVTFKNGGSWKVLFSVNGGYEYATSYTGESQMEFSFDANACTVSTDRTINAPVTTYLNGEAFKGFESGFVYLTFQLEGVYTTTASNPTRTASLVLDIINNQAISATKTDLVTPEVTSYVSKGDLAVGSVAEIPAFYVCDVINPYATVTVRVTDPAGNVVTSTDGVALDGTQDLSRSYNVELTQFGTYNINVNGTVGKANTAFNARYGIQVYDMKAPVITFINPVTEAKAGETVKFAGVNVTDDKSELSNVTVKAFLLAPNGRITNVDIQANGSFVASEAGVYRFYIYASDEGNRYGSTQMGNTAVAWYDITVTA